MQHTFCTFHCNDCREVTRFTEDGYCTQCGRHADNVVSKPKPPKPPDPGKPVGPFHYRNPDAWIG